MIDTEQMLEALLLAEVRSKVGCRCTTIRELSIKGGDFVLRADGKVARVEVPPVQNLSVDAQNVADALIERLH